MAPANKSSTKPPAKKKAKKKALGKKKKQSASSKEAAAIAKESQKPAHGSEECRIHRCYNSTENHWKPQSM